MAGSTTWLNANLTGTAGGISVLNEAGLGNSTPGTTGAGEISGGSYASIAITWSSVASATATNSASMSWNVPASTSGIGWVLLKNSTTYMTDLVIGTPVSFSSAGTLMAASGALSLSVSQTA